MAVENPEFIVIGKQDDVDRYDELPGAHVLHRRDDWTPDMNLGFVRDAIQHGYGILFASWNISGQYKQELIWMLEMLTKE